MPRYKGVAALPPRTLQCTVIRAVITALAETECMHVSAVSYSDCVVTYQKHVTFIRQKKILSVTKKKRFTNRSQKPAT